MAKIAIFLILLLLWSPTIVEEAAPLDSKPVESPIFSLPIARPSLELMGKKEYINWVFTPQLRKVLAFADYAQIKQAAEERTLVEVMAVSQNSGLYLRTDGKYPIGEIEKDKNNRKLLLYLRPEAARLLYEVAHRYKQKTKHAITITSLVRPATYQARLARFTPNADTVKQNILPTHTFGLAFDISRKILTKSQDQALEAILSELEKDDLCIYLKEGLRQATYHVITYPNSIELDQDLNKSPTDKT
jgi:hypothetical protein